jgi:hypothetical protein
MLLLLRSPTPRYQDDQLDREGDQAMPLMIDPRPDDERRCRRLLIAWLDGDELAAHAVLDEVMSDDVGVPGLLFTMTDFSARLGNQVAPDFRGQLQAMLLVDQDDGTGDERGEN